MLLFANGSGVRMSHRPKSQHCSGSDNMFWEAHEVQGKSSSGPHVWACHVARSYQERGWERTFLCLRTLMLSDDKESARLFLEESPSSEVSELLLPLCFLDLDFEGFLSFICSAHTMRTSHKTQPRSLFIVLATLAHLHARLHVQARQRLRASCRSVNTEISGGIGQCKELVWQAVWQDCPARLLVLGLLVLLALVLVVVVVVVGGGLQGGGLGPRHLLCGLRCAGVRAAGGHNTTYQPPFCTFMPFLYH